MALIIAGAIVGGFIGYLLEKDEVKEGYNINNKKSCNCVDSHKQNGGNYEWLDVLGLGKLIKVEFKEGDHDWEIYNEHWWEVHCKVVNHGKDLYNSHMKAFVLE